MSVKSVVKEEPKEETIAGSEFEKEELKSDEDLALDLGTKNGAEEELPAKSGLKEASEEKFIPDFCKFINKRFWEAHEQEDSNNQVVNLKTSEENKRLAKEREHQEYLKAKAS